MYIGRRQFRGGFTLLELLVAMSIMAVITASLYSTLSLAFKMKDSIREKLGPLARANAVLDMMRSDLNCCVDPEMELAGAFIGEQASVNDNDRLVFYSSNNSSLRELENAACDIYQVEYSLEQYDQWNGYSLVKRTAVNLLSSSEPESKDNILCRGVYGLRFSYYDGASWQASWDSETADSPLPKLLKVTIILTRADKIDFDEPETMAVTRIFGLPEAGSDSQEQDSQGAVNAPMP